MMGLMKEHPNELLTREDWIADFRERHRSHGRISTSPRGFQAAECQGCGQWLVLCDSDGEPA